MANNSRKWIQVSPEAETGEKSVQQVVSSDFTDIRVRSMDEEAMGSTRVNYQVKGIWQDVFSFKEADFDTLRVPGAGRMQIEGHPEIPQEGLLVAIPDNAEVKEIRVTSKKEKELDGEYYILPASKPVLETEEPEYIPDKEVYEKDEFLPGKYSELVGTEYVAGRKVAHIIVYLMQYNAKSRKVKALESIDLDVVYETRHGMDSPVKRRLLRKSPMDGMILDSGSVSEGERLRAEKEKKTDLDSSGLKDPNNQGEYLIITARNLISSLSQLVTLKSGTYKVMTVAVEDIYGEFPSADHDVSIRNFLIYATGNWDVPPEWVVLAGDVDIIPTHDTHYQTPGYTTRDMVSDHYYANLTGDLSPDIVVSRLPVSNAADMQSLCSRIATFTNAAGEWRNKIILTAYQSSGYINCKKQISSELGSTNFQVIERYAGQSSKQAVIDAINDGVVIINYRGHGDVTDWQASNGLNIADVQSLNNGHMTPLVLSVACLNSYIDHSGECFAEAWIRNEKAIAFLGASRASFTSPNHDFDEYLFEAIIDQGLTTAGHIMNWGKTRLFQNYPGTLASDNIRMYLLLGDPTASIKPKKEDAMGKEMCIGLYDLSADGNGLVSWQAPDGFTYKLDPKLATPGDWYIVNDNGGKPVMAYIENPGRKYSGDDGVLIVSLAGSPCRAATLLHNEDDFADRIYYFATDAGNNNILKRNAFILRAQGVKGCPVSSWRAFKIMCAG